jgi:hypothetical protein
MQTQRNVLSFATLVDGRYMPIVLIKANQRRP